MQSLLSNGMTYSIVACAAIGTDCAENTIPVVVVAVVVVAVDAAAVVVAVAAAAVVVYGMLPSNGWLL
jgi:hypothetical protein